VVEQALQLLLGALPLAAFSPVCFLAMFSDVFLVGYKGTKNPSYINKNVSF
jgi:hypothetical protein